MSDYDVIVLGGGPGGYIAAERLGHAGKKVLLVEGQYLGGTCLNVGCIPTKTLLNAAKSYAHAQHGARIGLTVEGLSLDWAKLQAWKKKVVDTLVGGVAQSEKKAGVEVLEAYGRFEGPGRVSADGRTYTAEHVILATGSVPVMPPIPGVRDNPQVVDSTGLLDIPEQPKRLVVIGGGVIGIEFASLFATLGSQVSVIEMLPEIVPNMDTELAATMRRALKGIDFHLSCRVTKVDGGTVHFEAADASPGSVEADVVLMAVGRRAALEGWGAQESGLDIGRGGIVVDDRMRTNLPGVWAVGDVTGRSLLAHAAYRMGEVAVANILDPQAHRRGEVMRWHLVPWAVYSLPEAAGVGLTEQQARAAGRDVVTATVPGYMSGRFIAEEGAQAVGASKIVVDARTRQVLGIHLLAPYASEAIWGATAVLETELSIDDLRQVVIPHPTISELIREAAWAVTA